MHPIFRELTTPTDGPCVSIFLPVHAALAGRQEDATRLKNLLRDGQRELEAHGLRRVEAEEILAPAGRVLEEEGLRARAGEGREGLALFCSPGRFHRLDLPRPCPERVEVGPRFVLRPLLPQLAGTERFYLLALSQNRVRLFEGDRDHVRERALGDDVPQSLADALGHETTPQALQFHTGTAGGGEGRRPAVFHGQGGGEDEHKDEIARFCRRVDDGLRAVLGKEQPPPPLVVASVGYLIPIYREASRYPHVLEEGVEGNPDEADAAALHARAWALVAPRVEAARRGAAERCRALLASGGPAGADLDDVLLAACDGRVDTLFVASDAEQRGRLNTAARRVETEGDEDLLDRAALEVVAQGGAVHAVPRADVPVEGGGTIAAIYRW